MGMSFSLYVVCVCLTIHCVPEGLCDLLLSL